MKKISLFLFLLVTSMIFVSAVPQLPMIISGNASINGGPAKIGTEVSARVNGDDVSKIKISDEGKFTLLLQKLEENQEVGFYVDGIYANETVSYKSGDFKQLSLKVEKSYILYYLLAVIATLLLTTGILIWKKKRKQQLRKE